MPELRFLVMVRRERGEIYNSDKYMTEQMTSEEIIDAFREFVENAIESERLTMGGRNEED